MAKKKKEEERDILLDGIFLEDAERLEMLYYETLAVNVDLSVRILELEKVVQSLQAELVIAKAKENDFVRKDKIKELKDRKNKHIEMIKSRKDLVNKKYNIDLTKCVFDDETGKITLLDD